MATSEQFMGKRRGLVVMRNPEIVRLEDVLPPGVDTKGAELGILHRRAWEVRNNGDQLVMFVRRPKRGLFKNREQLFDAYKIRDPRNAPGEMVLWTAVLWLIPQIEPEKPTSTHTYIDHDLQLLMDLFGGGPQE